MISTLWRFKGFLGRYWLPIVLGGLFTVGSALFALAQPWPLKIIVDSVLNDEPLRLPGADIAEEWSRTGLLQAAIVAYLLIAAAGALCDYLGILLMNSSGQRLVVNIRETLFSRLQRLSLRFHARQRTGDLISRVMSDIDRIQNMVVQSFSILIPNLVLLTGMLIVMLSIDWAFTLLALSVAPLLFAVVFRYTAGIKSASRRARGKEGELAAKTGEVLGSIRVVQAFTREDYEDDRFSAESSQSLAANLEAIRLQAQFSPLVDVLAAIGTVMVLYLGTRRVLSGQLQLGTLLVFISYISSLYKPMRQLSKLASVTSKGIASAERISEVMDVESDVADLPGARSAPPLEGRVEFEDVEFAYTKDPVLNDINLAVQPGQTIALVGPTGAGKSSLVSLIPRFFDPRKGKVLVDGEDVRSYELRSLRAQISLVLQEPLLFEGTIFDNIAYGNPDADEQEILRAARVALVDDFVRELPKSYETRIGERGATLSGGERQRISIARALVRNAPILILDEPTSALDPASEQLVMRAIRKLVEGRTSFVIAHRMSTILGADQILVLDHGRVVEQGTHNELLQMSDGMYRSFLEQQVGPTARSYISTLLGSQSSDPMLSHEPVSRAISSLPDEDAIPADGKVTAAKRKPRADLAFNPERVEPLLARVMGGKIKIAGIQELKRTERRIVVRYEVAGKRAVIGKWFSTDRGATVADALQQLRALGFDGRLAVPKLIGYLSDERVLFVEAVSGPLLREIMSEHPKDAIHAGVWLASFHTSGFISPRNCGPTKQLGAVRRWSENVDSLEGLSFELEEALKNLDDPALPVHYDFYHSQMIMRPEGSTVMLDLDEAGMGDPYFDLAHFKAHARLLSLQWFGDPDRFEQLQEAIVEGYTSIRQLPESKPALDAFAWFKLAYQLIKRQAPSSQSSYATDAVRRSLSAS
jgi:ATP-binding cassette, subfamily B, bacterial